MLLIRTCDVLALLVEQAVMEARRTASDVRRGAIRADDVDVAHLYRVADIAHGFANVLSYGVLRRPRTARWCLRYRWSVAGTQGRRWIVARCAERGPYHLARLEKVVGPIAPEDRAGPGALLGPLAVSTRPPSDPPAGGRPVAPWSAEQRLTDLGIVLPPAGSPQARYASCVQVGSLLFVSGKGPGGDVPPGRLGRDLTTADGARLARAAGLEVLATVRDHLGSLDRVARVVRVQGFVNATEDYDEHHLALDGLSTLLVDVFGDAGVHARSVLGAVSLRGGLPVIVECLFEVRDTDGDA